jgi:hypothetical protein
MDITISPFRRFKSENESRFLNFFWMGFIIYTSAFAISTTGQVSYVVCNLFQIIGLILIIPASFFLIDFRLDDVYLKAIISLYLIWTMGVIVRGFLFDYEFIKLIIFNAYEALFIYMVPIILFFPRNLHHIKKVFFVIMILGFVYVLYDMLFIRELVINYDIKNSQAIIEYFSKTLSIPCGFIILTYIYHTRKMNLIALFVIGLTFVLAIIRARRGLAFLAIYPIIGAYFVYLVYSKNRILKVVFFFLLAIMITLGIAYSQTLLSYFGQNSATSWFMDRITQDTRSEVEEYFYQDMKSADWVIGKGINGQYYCPGVVEGAGKISIFRRGIETDYLTIILKGGLVSLGLMLLITLPAIIKGLFHSKNLLSKASAAWIILYLAALYPAPVTTFTLNYLLVWISVGLCYSREIRNMSDDELVEFFSKKKTDSIFN